MEKNHGLNYIRGIGAILIVLYHYTTRYFDVMYNMGAEAGDPDAQYNVAQCYYLGLGVEQNLLTAARWYIRAAEHGNADAQYILGTMFYKGMGVTQSYEEAVMWYDKAVKLGHPAAQYDLGICYYYGQGVVQNREKAVELWKLAAEQEFEDAVAALKDLKE